MIDSTFLGAPPTGLLERSKTRVQNICYFGDAHYDTYTMVGGHSAYTGSIDYRHVTIL